MAVPTIVATVGSASANSFVTIAEIIVYMSGRLNNSTWSSVTGSTLTDNETKAVLESTRELDRQVWEGLRVDTTQALAWPRQLVSDPDSPNADYFSSTTMPERVKDACMELAFQFIKAGTTDVAALAPLHGIKRERIDVLETEYDQHQTRTGLRRYPRVWGLIAPLLAHSSALTAPLVKG